MCSGGATGTGEPTVSLNGSPAKGSFPTHGRARSSTSHLPSSTSEPVQTQPCSLKGSLSSDNIYAGLHGTTGAQAPTGQGDHQQHTTEHLSCTAFTLVFHCKYLTPLVCGVLRLGISICPLLTLVFSSLFDYTPLQAGLITLNHLRE